MDHDVEDKTRPPHNDGGVDHEIERATQEQPLLDKSEDKIAVMIVIILMTVVVLLIYH